MFNGRSLGAWRRIVLPPPRGREPSLGHEMFAPAGVRRLDAPFGAADKTVIANSLPIEQSLTASSERLLTSTSTHSSSWRAVIGAFFGLATGPSVLLLLVFGIFAPSLRTQFGWDTGSVSLGATIVSLTLAFLSPLQGRLVDRWGVRRVVLASLPPFGIGMALMAMLGPDIRLFYIACALLACAGVGLWPLSYLTLVSGWFDRRLGIALGVAQVGAGLGGALVPVLLTAIFTVWSWRAGYLMLGAAQLIVMLPIALWAVREAPARNEDATIRVAAIPGLSIQEVLRKPSFYLLLVAFLMLGAFSSGVIIHQVSILIDHGIARRTATLVQSVLLGSAVIGRLVCGWALDRVRIVRLMPALLSVSATATLIYAAHASVAATIGCAVLIGFAVGAEFDVLGYAIRRYFGLRAYGVIYGAIFSLFQIGSAAGAALVGFSRQVEGSYTPGVVMLASCCLIASGAMALLGPYRFAVTRSMPGEPVQR